MTLMTLTALYDARAEADRAAEQLVRDVGVARGDVAVMAQETTAAGSGTSTVGAGESTGFFGSLRHYLGRIPESASVFSALDTWAKSHKSLRLQGNYSFLPR